VVQIEWMCRSYNHIVECPWLCVTLKCEFWAYLFVMRLGCLDVKGSSGPNRAPCFLADLSLGLTIDQFYLFLPTYATFLIDSGGEKCGPI